MKHRYSDLLDAVSAEDVTLKKMPLVSSRRIREKTFEQLGVSKKKRKLSVISRVAVVAAVFASLMITACAADTMFNDGAFFGGFFGNDFTEKQQALFEDMGQNFNQSVTSNGTTITLLWGIADEDCMYLHFRVEAPEGVVLPDIPENQRYSLRDKNLKHSVFVHYLPDDYQRPNNWKKSWCDPGVTPLPDRDPADNVKEFVVRLWKDSKNDNFIFNGPWPKRLTFEGLFIHQLRDKGCERLFSGSFDFDISIHNENRELQSVTVDAGGVTYYNEEYDFTTTVHSVTITPLRIMVDCERTEANNQYIFPRGGPIRIVMKDGSTINAMDAYYDAAAHYYPHPDSVVDVGCESGFDIPIVVEEIDYLIIGEDHIVDVN